MAASQLLFNYLPPAWNRCEAAGRAPAHSLRTERRFGHDVSERELYLVDTDRVEDIPATLALTGTHFVCMLAWDASGIADEKIQELARRLFDAGCVYICCWGVECSRVHDLFDLVDVQRAPDGPFVMSTWHEEQPLSEALWFMLFNAYPDDALSGGCRSSVAISVGSRDWAAAIRNAMMGPRKFNADVVEADSS